MSCSWGTAFIPFLGGGEITFTWMGSFYLYAFTTFLELLFCLFVVVGVNVGAVTAKTLYYLITLANYGGNRRRRNVPVLNTCGAVAIRGNSEILRSGCDTDVGKHRSISVCPRMNKALRHLYMHRNSQMARKRALFVVSRIPFRTTLGATRTGLGTTRTTRTATGLAYRDAGHLFSRGIMSRFSLRGTRGTLLDTRTTITRTGTRIMGTHGDLSCAIIGDPSGNVINRLPCHRNTLMNDTVPGPLAAVSSGDRLCICFSVGRGSLLDLMHGCNSLRTTTGGVPTMDLRLGSNAVLTRGNHIRAVDNIVGTGANSTRIHTSFPGASRLLRDNTGNGIVIPIRGSSMVVVPRTTAHRVRSRVVIFGIVSNGTIDAGVGMSPVDGNRRCVIASNLRMNRIVITRKTNVVHRKAPVNGPTGRKRTTRKRTARDGWRA